MGLTLTIEDMFNADMNVNAFSSYVKRELWILTIIRSFFLSQKLYAVTISEKLSLAASASYTRIEKLPLTPHIAT